MLLVFTSDSAYNNTVNAKAYQDLMSNTPLVWGLVYCCVGLLFVAVKDKKGKRCTVLYFCKEGEQEK
jgi:hypothetical protein